MELRLAYAVSLRSPQAFQHLLEHTTGLQVTPVLTGPATCAVVVESPFVHQAHADDYWRVVDKDLARLSERWPIFAGRRLEVDDREIGSRWPILWDVRSDVDSSPDRTTVATSFENVLLRRCSRDDFDTSCKIAACLLARYRTLAESVEQCQQLLSRLGQGTRLDSSADLSEQLSDLRSEISVAFVATDPTPFIYWRYQGQLAQDLRELWQLPALETSARQAVETTGRIIQDSLAARENEEAAKRSRQLRTAKNWLAALGIFNLLLATIELVTFASSTEALRLGAVSRVTVAVLLMVAAFAGLVVLGTVQSRWDARSRPVGQG